MKNVVIVNPTNYLTDSAHVLRGGSWYFHIGYCRSIFRYRNVPVIRHFNFGFRVVKGIKDEKGSYIKSN